MFGQGTKTFVIKNVYERLCFVRCFHQTKIENSEYKAMAKIMKATNPNKKRRFIGGDFSNPSVLSSGSHEGKKSVNARRSLVLNKLFMGYITDLMATGESSSNFVGHGIEISRVQVWPDFKGINVFWVAKGTEEDSKIEEILNSNSRALRHELSQLRLIGNVPKLTFVKDKVYAKLAEIDAILKKVDFGEDHTPVDYASQFKSELKINYTLDPQTKQKIENAEKEYDIEEELNSLPPMPNNVLGLNHNEIMKKVIKGMKKSEPEHRKFNLPPADDVNEEKEFLDSKQQKESIKNFLHKRQVLKAKASKCKNPDKLIREMLSENDEENYISEEIISEFIKDHNIDDEVEEEDIDRSYRY